MTEVHHIEGPHVIVKTAYDDNPWRHVDQHDISLCVGDEYMAGSIADILPLLQNYHHKGFKIVFGEPLQEDTRQKIDTLLKQTA